MAGQVRSFRPGENMFKELFKKIIGDPHQKAIKKISPQVGEINQVYDTLEKLSDDELRAKTDVFRARIKKVTDTFGPEDPDKGEEQEERAQRLKRERKQLQEALDEILVEAFAVVKDGCRRLRGTSWLAAEIEIDWEMIPFDVQLIGGIILHQGKVAEMATGEGKTLVATLPIYLTAVSDLGVHVVTVNDFLARRDSEWMGKLLEFIGISVGCIQTGMSPPERKIEYAKDVTYGTNNEFGFDYLRDNMCSHADDMVQRGHNFAIVDEVDSALIDEARTPLIISGPVQSNIHQRYREMKPTVDTLVRKQQRLVGEYLIEAESCLKNGSDEDRYKAGQRLLAVSRGAPKNKKFLKMKKETGIAKLITDVEGDYIRDKKLHELDESLYFVIIERDNSITLTDNGEEQFPKDVQDLFVIPDLSEALSQLAGDDSLSADDRHQKTEKLYSLHAERSEKVHSIQQLLKAYMLFEKDVEYVIQDDKIIIVDEFTGRMMPGRRYSDGLHQSIEAKEGVRIESESQTLATVTLQNYFRLYSKLAGMTGTAETEADEFADIYGLDVVCIPPNKPIIRDDKDDEIYRTRREKYNGIIEEIKATHDAGRPVLVGTVSVEVSETLSRMLQRQKIPHNVLNAKFHQKESSIVMHAGQPGAVTIATNMAGRGTDIKLGPGVAKAGGLHIVGTERHESRRIDRQLRGRAGRQGDPGSSKFFLSIEDNLMRLFGGDRLGTIMDKLGLQEGEVIKAKMVTRAIERAQKKVEAQNFHYRKHTLEYDDVMNVQRKWIYQRRSSALTRPSIKDEALELIEATVDMYIDSHCPPKTEPYEWDLEGLKANLRATFLLSVDFPDPDKETIYTDQLRKNLFGAVKHIYEQKENAIGSETMRKLEKRSEEHTSEIQAQEDLEC
ncbi:MAG: preprotein translocase subunit SecA, partial [candidate division Zixibacteria bacterium]|nr:preprotein translocase subunit SecA [candidate division Zixibacteria bacterium]